jgi:DNA-binding HxlR family transcriptional regulator
MNDHPTAGLDELVHQRHRLGILTITSKARQADFGYLREELGLTSGNLSTHLTVLEDAGLIKVEKGYEGRRPRTWVSITREGRAALATEIDALTRIVHDHSPPGITSPSNTPASNPPPGNAPASNPPPGNARPDNAATNSAATSPASESAPDPSAPDPSAPTPISPEAPHDRDN